MTPDGASCSPTARAASSVTSGRGCPRPGKPQREKPFTSAEREAFRQRCEAERRAREAEEARRHAEAREKAAEILEAATGDPATHPYAIKKRIPLGPLVKRGPWPQRGWTDALLVPIYGGDGRCVVYRGDQRRR